MMMVMVRAKAPLLPTKGRDLLFHISVRRWFTPSPASSACDKSPAIRGELPVMTVKPLLHSIGIWGSRHQGDCFMLRLPLVPHGVAALRPESKHP